MSNPDQADEFDRLRSDIATYVQLATDQQAEIEQLRAALKPLADLAEDIDSGPNGKLRPDDTRIWFWNNLTFGHARAARKALEG